MHASDTQKSNLRIPNVTIAWMGVRGLGWTGFRREIEAKVLFSDSPKLIIIHLGGNDLTLLTTVQIKRCIREEVRYLREAFSETVIVWIDILPRRVWRGAVDGSNVVDRKRNRLNRIGRQIVRASGKHDIVVPDIDVESGFFLDDGVHLNFVGLEFYLDYVKDIIVKHC